MFRVQLVRVTLAILLSTGLTPHDGIASDNTKEKEEQRELHIVGLYQGVYKTGDQIHGGRARVEIKRPVKRVTLVLSAHEQVTWDVTVGPDSLVEKVILAGSDRQAVRDLAAKVDLVEAFRDKGRDGDFYAGYRIDSREFRDAIDAIGKLSNVPIRSFQGAYDYRHDAPFIIDKIQNDARLSADYPKVSPPEDLPKVRFRAMLYAMDTRARDIASASYADFVLKGKGPKVDDFQSMPKGVRRVAYDPTAKRYYGILDHEIVEVNLDSGTTAAMHLGLDVPRLSWPCEITFDTKRGRLLVVSSTGQYLYCYTTKTGKWSVLAEKLGVDALTYHPNLDALFGLAPAHPDESEPMLLQFNEKGEVTKRRKLTAPIHEWVMSRGPGVCRTQIVAADDYLAILCSPDLHQSRARASEAYIYIVDPKTGKSWLAWKD